MRMWPVNVCSARNSLGCSDSGKSPCIPANVASGTSNADGYVRGAVELYLAAYTGTPTAGTGVSNTAAIGRLLYTPLIDHLQANGCHALMAVISLPNAASVALHESLGFVKVGHLREVGRKFDRWLDIGHWQRLL